MERITHLAEDIVAFLAGVELLILVGAKPPRHRNRIPDSLAWRKRYAGLAVAIALIHTRRGYFSEIISELLYWLGSDRILFGSDYAIWHPKWIIEQFMELELSEELAAEANHTLTLEIKKKIMGENCARLYDIDIAEQCARLGLPALAEPAGKDVDVGVA